MQTFKVKILDCTLRDAGYPTKFQFSKNDIRRITRRLEQNRVPLIEVGHGLGVGADNNSKFTTPLVDNLCAVREARLSTETSKIGVFFIPGIGNISQVKPLCAEGLDFIRVGYDACKLENILSDLERLLTLDLSVSVNLMKSNELTSAQLDDKLKLIEDFPVNTVSIVDSSGCMLPKTIAEMVSIIKSKNFDAGFHGHDNIGLAMTNCFAAIEGGASIIDSTLAGLGRSLGNVKTEQIAIALKKSGVVEDCDVMGLLQLAYDFSKKFCKNTIDVDQILMGYAGLHSGLEENVRKVCFENAIDFREFLFSTGENSPGFFNHKLVEKAPVQAVENRPESISWRSENFDDFCDNITAKSVITPGKVIVVAHQKEGFIYKFSKEYKLRGFSVFHVQVETESEITALVNLTKNLNAALYCSPEVTCPDSKIRLKSLPNPEYFEVSIVSKIIEIHHNYTVSYVADNQSILAICANHNDNVQSPIGNVQITGKFSKKIDFPDDAISYIIDRYVINSIDEEVFQESINKIRVIDDTDLINFWVTNDFLNSQRIKILDEIDLPLYSMPSENTVHQGIIAPKGATVVSIFGNDGDEILGVADGKGGIR